MTPGWGMLPDQAVQLIKKREWDHWTHLKARLSDERKFPIQLGLKPPDGKKALADMAHYLTFITAWKNFPFQEMVQWEPRNFQTLPGQTIPAALVISSIQDLAELMGKNGKARVKLWENNMRPILEAGSALPPPNPLYPVLVRRLDLIEKLSCADIRMLADLLPQLTPGMGKGFYLRALPVTGVDTKFIETHKLLIEELLNVLHGGAVTWTGGLLPWLDCMPRPAGWLMRSPLDKPARNALGCMPILKLPYMMLLTYELPAEHILVVENIESGLALPPMENTIAVIGGGKNVAWMDAVWLKEKHVGYWGDIDTWGLCFLRNEHEIRCPVRIFKRTAYNGRLF
jgi:hypothetical protein